MPKKQKGTKELRESNKTRERLNVEWTEGNEKEQEEQKGEINSTYKDAQAKAFRNRRGGGGVTTTRRRRREEGASQ